MEICGVLVRLRNLYKIVRQWYKFFLNLIAIKTQNTDERQKITNLKSEICWKNCRKWMKIAFESYLFHSWVKVSLAYFFIFMNNVECWMLLIKKSRKLIFTFFLKRSFHVNNEMKETVDRRWKWEHFNEMMMSWWEGVNDLQNNTLNIIANKT
jgi:hypothetical protein